MKSIICKKVEVVLLINIAVLSLFKVNMYKILYHFVFNFCYLFHVQTFNDSPCS